jgi:hypothetical protein
MEPFTILDYITVRLLRSGTGIRVKCIPRIIPWCDKKINNHRIRKLNATRNQVSARTRGHVDSSERYQRELADAEEAKEFNREHFGALETRKHTDPVLKSIAALDPPEASRPDNLLIFNIYYD